MASPRSPALALLQLVLVPVWRLVLVQQSVLVRRQSAVAPLSTALVVVVDRPRWTVRIGGAATRRHYRAENLTSRSTIPSGVSVALSSLGCNARGFTFSKLDIAWGHIRCFCVCDGDCVCVCVSCL